jgi:dethiobiotin synthetase
VACRIVVVTGTGTGIGKTHFAEALLLALGKRGLRAVGLKPIETGLAAVGVSDAERLTAASSFHVKHTGMRFGDPVSPHLAAREAGVPVELDEIAADLQRAAEPADVAVVELAGGAFTPLTDELTNADLALRLQAQAVLLVVPDRLGALHDTIATTRAARAVGLGIDGLVLMAQDQTDASSGRNEDELRRVQAIPLLAVLPRAAALALADHEHMEAVARRCAAGRAVR